MDQEAKKELLDQRVILDRGANLDLQDQEERRVTSEWRAIRVFQEPLDRRVFKDRRGKRVVMDKKDLQVLLDQWGTEASQDLRETLVRPGRWALQVLREQKANWASLVRLGPEGTMDFKVHLVLQDIWAPRELQVIQARMDFPDLQETEEKWVCPVPLVNQVLLVNPVIRDQQDQQGLPETEEYQDFWVHQENEVHPANQAMMAFLALQDRKDRLAQSGQLDPEASQVKEVSLDHPAQKGQEAIQETWALPDNRDQKAV